MRSDHSPSVYSNCAPIYYGSGVVLSLREMANTIKIAIEEWAIPREKGRQREGWLG